MKSPSRLALTLSAIFVASVVSIIGLQPALAVDPPQFEQSSYLRVAIHEIAHGKMDEYRAAMSKFTNELYRQSPDPDQFAFPLVAYRDVGHGVLGPIGETRAPAASYTFGTAFDTPHELRSWDQEVERTIRQNPRTADALKRVMDLVQERQVLLLERRDDLSTRYEELPEEAKGKLSTIHFQARPEQGAAMAKALRRIATMAWSDTAPSAHMTVFEVAEGNRGTEFVVVTRQEEDLGLTSPFRPNHQPFTKKAQALRDLWNTVHRFEKRYIEIDESISYRP